MCDVERANFTESIWNNESKQVVGNHYNKKSRWFVNNALVNKNMNLWFHKYLIFLSFVLNFTCFFSLGFSTSNLFFFEFLNSLSILILAIVKNTLATNAINKYFNRMQLAMQIVCGLLRKTLISTLASVRPFMRVLACIRCKVRLNSQKLNNVGNKIKRSTFSNKKWKILH